MKYCVSDSACLSIFLMNQLKLNFVLWIHWNRATESCTEGQITSNIYFVIFFLAAGKVSTTTGTINA